MFSAKTFMEQLLQYGHERSGEGLAKAVLTGVSHSHGWGKTGLAQTQMGPTLTKKAHEAGGDMQHNCNKPLRQPQLD